ncbi:MAG: hypothetical protein M0R51_15970, partial [Clostridia bacterium]|nr:hypothetical protein [Clostridia bacterium]
MDRSDVIVLVASILDDNTSSVDRVAVTSEELTINDDNPMNEDNVDDIELIPLTAPSIDMSNDNTEVISTILSTCPSTITS